MYAALKNANLQQTQNNQISGILCCDGLHVDCKTKPSAANKAKKIWHQLSFLDVAIWIPW